MRLTTIATTWIVFITFGLTVGAQTNAPSADLIRRLTLDESITLALRHNLSLKIQAFEPQLVRYSLSAAYGAYDPIFGAQAQRRVANSQGGLDPDTGEQFAGSERTSDEYSTSLSGVLPTGLSYDIIGNLNRRQGTDSRLIIGPGITNIVDTKFSFFDGSAGGIQLSQPFLRDFWIDSTRYQIKIAKKDLRISELAYTFSVMDMVRTVEQAYYNLIFAIGNVATLEKDLAVRERSTFEASEKLKVGSGTELEMKAAQANTEISKSALINARYLVTLQENVLKGLITDNYAEVHRVHLEPSDQLEAIPQVYDLGQAWFLALSGRPDYQQEMLRLQQAEIGEKFRFNQLFPRLDAFGSYSHAGLGLYEGDVLDDLRRGTSPNYSYGVRLSIPLTLRTERNQYRAAQAQRERADLLVKQLEQQILVRVSDAINRAKATFEDVAATRQARIHAEAVVAADEKRLGAGVITPSILLDNQRVLTVQRSEEIRALRDYNQALSELRFLQGINLQRHRIDLSFY